MNLPNKMDTHEPTTDAQDRDGTSAVPATRVSLLCLFPASSPERAATMNRVVMIP